VVLGHLDLPALLVLAVVEVAPLQAEVAQAEVELLRLGHAVREGEAHPLLVGRLDGCEGEEREEEYFNGV